MVLNILKNMSSSMGRMTSHILWKIKFMFQTTNQFLDILRTIVEILLIYDLWRSNYFLLYHGALHGPIIKCLPTSLPWSWASFPWQVWSRSTLQVSGDLGPTRELQHEISIHHHPKKIPSGNVLLVAIEAMPIEIVDLCWFTELKDGDIP